MTWVTSGTATDTAGSLTDLDVVRDSDDAAEVGVDADVVPGHGELKMAPLGRLQTETLLHQDRLVLLSAGARAELLKLGTLSSE